MFFLCRKPLISRQESFRPEVLITVVLALPSPFLNTQARTHTSSPTLLMCPLGLQWLRHKDSQPTDSHPHTKSIALLPMMPSLCPDRVDFLVDSRHFYDAVCGLGLLCWIHLYVCGPAFPLLARVYLSACVCGGWFGSQLRFNVGVSDKSFSSEILLYT